MKFICNDCGKEYPINTLKYKCDCEGLFSLIKEKNEKIEKKISLGEVITPIIKRTIDNIDINLKLDYFMPTGSFKDRGALVLINALKEMGINEIVEDSSGNAGASIAAYCAAANIKCNIYVPEGTSEGKIKQIKAYGANIIKVKGTRDDTAKQTLKSANTTYYASHVYNPLFFEGTKTIALEIYEQMGIPDYIIVPVGNGTMLLGVYLGFKEIGNIPKIIGVQSKNCSPIYDKYFGVKSEVVSSTIAEGIAVGQPKRIDEIIKAIKESNGDIITVSDDEVISAWRKLSNIGIYTELTSATVLAGIFNYFNNGYDSRKTIVAPLSGIGLKK